MNHSLPAKFRSARVISVVEVRVAEGLGTEAHPIREVTYYLDPDDGEVLAIHDPQRIIRRSAERGPVMDMTDEQWERFRYRNEAASNDA